MLSFFYSFVKYKKRSKQPHTGFAFKISRKTNNVSARLLTNIFSSYYGIHYHQDNKKKRPLLRKAESEKIITKQLSTKVLSNQHKSHVN